MYVNDGPTMPHVETTDAAPGTTTVLVVDDHRSFADLLAGALGTVAGFRCVGTAHSAAEGVARVVALRPQVVVMDVQMPGADGLQATRQVLAVAPGTLVAVVTAHRDPAWVSRAAQAGAAGFVPKDVPLSELIEVLLNLRRGQLVVAPSTFVATRRPADASRPVLPHLTERELEVLRLLGDGTNVKLVARHLGITLSTCRGHIKSLHSKLGASNQLEVVLKAQQLGLLQPGPDR